MELVAGTARLTHAVAEIGGALVVCDPPEDIDEDWDILKDVDVQTTLNELKGIGK